MAVASPIPKAQVVIEVVRMVLLTVCLVAVTALFAAEHFWTGAILLAAVTIGCLVTGALGSPAQVAAARRPASVTTVEATVWHYQKRPWLVLGTDDPDSPAVELRWQRHAKLMMQAVFAVKVAGRLEPGEWVVLQVGQVTIWPAGKVRGGMARGAYRARPEHFSFFSRLRYRGPGRSAP